MAEIDIGQKAIDREQYAGPEHTMITRFNPANASGKITKVEIWAYEDLSGCKVAIFYRPDPDNYPNNLSTRDWEYIGNVIAGSKQTFDVNLNVVEGDYIGIYFSDGKIEERTGSPSAGEYWYRVYKDYIPCENVEFYTDVWYRISLYGIGISQTGIPVVGDPTFSNTKATSTTATANVSDDGGGYEERGFEYGLTETDTWTVRETGTFTGTGNFSLQITGLEPNTKYYVRAYLHSKKYGTAYSNYTSFTTTSVFDYGIYEETNEATICFYVRQIGGKWSIKHGPYTTDQADIEIGKILVEGKGRYQIKIESNVLTGISTSVLVKMDIKARTGD